MRAAVSGRKLIMKHPESSNAKFPKGKANPRRPELNIIHATPPTSPSIRPTTPVGSIRSYEEAARRKSFESQDTSADNHSEVSLSVLRPRARTGSQIEDLRLLAVHREQQEELQRIFTDRSKSRFRWCHVPYNVLRWAPDIMHSIDSNTERLRLHETLLLARHFDSRQNLAGHKGPHSRSMRPGNFRYFLYIHARKRTYQKRASSEILTSFPSFCSPRYPRIFRIRKKRSK